MQPPRSSSSINEKVSSSKNNSNINVIVEETGEKSSTSSSIDCSSSQQQYHTQNTNNIMLDSSNNFGHHFLDSAAILQQTLAAAQLRNAAQLNQSRIQQQSPSSSQQRFNLIGNFADQQLMAQQLLLARAALFPNVPAAGASPYPYLLSANAAAPFYFSVDVAQQQQLLPPPRNNLNSPQNEPQQQQSGGGGTATRRQSIVNADFINKNNSNSNSLNNQQMTMESASISATTLNVPRSTTTSTAAVLSAEEIEQRIQRITRLISENEAIVEPSPMLTKRRPYARQHHGSLDYTTMRPSSPGRSSTTGRGIRSQSLIETSSPPLIPPLVHPPPPQQQTNVSSTSNNLPPCNENANRTSSKIAVDRTSSMNALNFHAQVETATIEAMNKLYNCKFCSLGVRHVDELKRHEEKCARREETTTTTVVQSKPATPTMENNKFPLKKRILAAAEKDSFTTMAASKSNNSAPTVVENAPISTASSEPPIFSPSSASICEKNNHRILQRQQHVFEPSSAPRFVASDAYLRLIPKVTLSSNEQSGILHPYCVTVKVPGAVSLEPTGAGRKLHQVTHPTNSSSLRQLWPCGGVSLLDSCKNSEYSSWSQIAVSPLESKLNIMLMDGCIMRPHRPYLNYTVAQKDLNLMRVTHSSFWTYSQKLQVNNNNSQNNNQPNLSPNVGVVTEEQQQHQISTIDEENDVEMSSVNSSSSTIVSNSSTVIATTTAATTSSSLSKELLKNILTANNNNSNNQHNGNNQSVRKVAVCNGGYKTNEAYTYVRGRGRGRYVCARCGIRCKKPSMLKKHIKSHLNVRPYSCSQCMFSFKTKGNLTKHLKSKSHTKKCASLQSNDERNGCSSAMDMSGAGDTAEEDSDETLSEDELETISDDEIDTMDQQIWQHGTDSTNELRQRTFPFKNIWNRIRTGMYFERQIKTPPLDFLRTLDDNWADRCDSAPPSLTIEANSYEFCFSNPSSDQISSNINNNNNTKNNETKTISSSSLENNNDQQRQEQSQIEIQSEITSNNNSSSLSKNNYLKNCLSEGKIQCEQCGKEFVKIALLKLHTAAHMFEQSSRRYDSKCPLCSSCFRSKNLLQKHLLHAHPQQNNNAANNSSFSSNVSTTTMGIVKPTISCNNNSNNNQSVIVSNNNNNLTCQQQIMVSPTSTNPRPFECHDCNVAFRIHGHLAKHLRSKSHIMKLECLEKVPIGTFAKLEESNCDYFADIDTSDSHNSLQSLLKLARRLMNVDETKNGKIPALDSTTTNVVVSSLLCTEQLTISSPSPPPPPSKKLSYDSSSASKTVFADVWIPPKENNLSNNSTTNFKEPPHVNQQQQDSLLILNKNAEKLKEFTNNETISTTDQQGKNEKRCKFCHALFPSAAELEIHWHADHVHMRDGKNFKCPKANCDTVYPSKRDLKNHLASHYYGNLDSDSTTGNGASGGDVSKSTVAALSKKIGYCSGNVTISNNNNCNADSSSSSLNDGGNYSSKNNNKLKTANLVKFKFGSQASADNSPISDSDASRASAMSSRSVSPNPSPTINNCRQSNNLKRHSIDDTNCGVVLKRPSLTNVGVDEIQTISANINDVVNLTTGQIPNPTALGQISHPNPSPIAAPVPLIVPQRAGAPMPPAWTSFLNQSSPQQPLYLAGNPNPLSALLGLQHPAIMAAAAAVALQENMKLFNNGGVIWPPQQFLNAASPHLYSGLQNGGSPSNNNNNNSNSNSSSSTGQESGGVLFSIDHLRCNLCQKQCYSPLSLQEHLMWHNQPRLHICKFCDAGFTTAQALQAHMPCRLQKVRLKGGFDEKFFC